MKKKILLIEDHLELNENITELLTISGYEVYPATNGREGIEMAKTIIPDLIISDIMMADVDGWGVIQVLNKFVETASIPFIFLTAKTENIDFRKGMDLGADDYITKPFENSELLRSIEVRLNKIDQLKKQIQDSPILDTKQRSEESLFIKSGTVFIKVHYNEIIFLEASGDYVEIQLLNKSRHLVYITLKSMLAYLPEKFIRVHRSFIVNAEMINSIEDTTICIKDHFIPIGVSYKNDVFRKLNVLRPS